MDHGRASDEDRMRAVQAARRARVRRPGIDAAVWLGAAAIVLATVVFFAFHHPLPIGERIEPIDTTGQESSDGGPRVGWLDEGERFFITTQGSSACPTVPADMRVRDGIVVITLTDTRASFCTDDLASATYALEIPREVRGQEGIGILMRDEDGATHEAVIEQGSTSRGSRLEPSG
jgi:hypothetical protein